MTAIAFGYFNIFFSIVPFILRSVSLLIAKQLADDSFKSWTISQKIAFILPAAIFPLSSPRLKKTTETKNVFIRNIKISGSEVMFVYLLHAMNLILCLMAFLILVATSPAFTARIAKVERVSGVPLQMAMFCGCPAAWLLSASFTLLSDFFNPWSAINERAKCSSLCPPLPASQFTTEAIPLKGLNMAEDAQAEVEEYEAVEDNENSEDASEGSNRSAQEEAEDEEESVETLNKEITLEYKEIVEEAKLRKKLKNKKGDGKK